MPEKRNFLKYIVQSPGTHVRRSARRHFNFCSSAAKDFYNCTELLESACSLCDWVSLVRMGNSDQHLRAIVQDIVRRRIVFGLSRFISSEYHARFFELLEATEAAVVGGFVLHIMCLEEGIYRIVFPSQLSLIVPTGKGIKLDSGRKWLHFLSNCSGFEVTWDNDTSLPYSKFSSRTFFFNHISDNLQISLVECDDDNIFSTLVYAPETSIFNVLTSRRIYSFYPSLFTRRVNLETSTVLVGPVSGGSICPFRYGFTTYDSTSLAFLLHPCEEGCYSLTRNIGRMEGISRFRWGGWLGGYDHDSVYSEQSPDDIFEALDIEWRIGSRCCNVLCKYYRSGFIG